MAISSDDLLRLTGQAGLGPAQGTPSYETINQISQSHQTTPKKANTVIPARYQKGGVAEDERSARSAAEGGAMGGGLDQLSPRQQELAYRQAVMAMMPYFQEAVLLNAKPTTEIYTAEMLSHPPEQLSGYYGEMGDYQQARPAEQEPQYAQPIYTADMLEKPPSKLSGYYGELSGGYQEGGIVDPETGHVVRNYAGEGAGAYNYVDPRAAAPAPAPQMAQRSQEMNAAAAKGGGWVSPEETARIMGWNSIPGRGPVTQEDKDMADYIRQALMHEDIASAIKGGVPDVADLIDRYPSTSKFKPGYDQFGPTLDTILGPDYTRMKEQTAGMVPEDETPNFQEGGVAGQNPLEMLGLQPPQGAQQQPAAPKKKVAPKPQAQGPPRPYEFGPANYFFNAPALLRAIERQKATTEGQGAGAPAGMEEGGVIPKEFMQYLANGGLVKEFTPDHHLMFALGAKYALSPRQAAKGLDTISRSNPMPP
jgi:hypothetical protein